MHNLVDAGLAAIDVEDVVDNKVRQVVDTTNEHEDVVNLNVFIENVVLLQKKDKSIAHLYERLNVEDENVKYLINKNGVLCTKHVRDNSESVIQIVVPYKLRTELLKLAHDIASSGHLGVVKTKDRLLLAGFYWPSIGKDVAYYCKTCDVCQRTDKSCVKYKAQMVKPLVIDQPFYRISIDIVGPIAKSTEKGYVFILTVVDHATSWPEAYPLPHHKASTVAKCMIEYFSGFGLVKECLHDLGSEFTSELFQVFLDYFDVDQLKCTVMHP